jgi:membrane protease YdiL (CAAX protease family)
MEPVLEHSSSNDGTEQRVPAPEFLPDPWFAISWIVIFAILHVMGVSLYVAGYGNHLGVQGEIVEAAEIQKQVEAYMHTPAAMVGMSITGWCLVLPALLLASNFRGQSWRQTLAIRKFSVKSLWCWLLALVVYLALEGWVIDLLGIEQDDFMLSIAGSRHLPLALVTVLWAPLFEELLFRGYLFRAWRNSDLGLSGTLLLTSALFAMTHWGQYGWEPLGFLFAFSVMMGLAREKSGSVLLPVVLHALSNFVVVVLVIYMDVF